MLRPHQKHGGAQLEDCQTQGKQREPGTGGPTRERARYFKSLADTPTALFRECIMETLLSAFPIFRSGSEWLLFLKHGPFLIPLIAGLI